MTDATDDKQTDQWTPEEMVRAGKRADDVPMLLALAAAGIPGDVQELLVQGDAKRGIAPGALRKAFEADPGYAYAVDSKAKVIERTTPSAATFDILERLARNYPDLAGGYARHTGGVDIDLVVAVLSNALRPQAVGYPPESTFQRRVHAWMLACFGAEIAADGMERNHRFLEESLELVQSLGCSASEAHQLVDYVFARPKGEPLQEMGGVLVTLAALANAAMLDTNEAAETELARVWTKIEKIRAKQAAKPSHGPLPGGYPIVSDKPTGAADPRLASMPNPTPAQLASPLFEAVWQVIKLWDVNVPQFYTGYCGANGSHVALILNALQPTWFWNGADPDLNGTTPEDAMSDASIGMGKPEQIGTGLVGPVMYAVRVPLPHGKMQVLLLDTEERAHRAYADRQEDMIQVDAEIRLLDRLEPGTQLCIEDDKTLYATGQRLAAMGWATIGDSPLGPTVSITAAGIAAKALPR